MQISSPHQTPSRSFPLAGAIALLLAASMLTATAPAQSLARPGWVGSGLTASSWWRHAIVYELDPHYFQDTNNDGTGDIRGVTQRLDYLQSLGVDALLLQHVQPSGPPTEQVIDPVLGTLDEFDDLLLQASHHNIRVLIDLEHSSPGTDLSGVARFWLNRGIAGFGVTGDPGTSFQLSQLNSVTRTYVGERIIIGNFTPASDAQPKPARSTDPPLLALNPYLAPITQLNTAAIRTAMEENDASVKGPLIKSGSIIITDDALHPRSFTRLTPAPPNADAAKVIATVLLTSRTSSMLYFGQEIGLPATPSATIPWGEPVNPTARTRSVPNPAEVVTQDAEPKSLLNWYRQLTVLQHSNLTLRSGTNISLNHDEQQVLAWVRKPANPSSITPPVVFICNLSAQPVQLSLTADMQKLHLRGSFLRTILRSDDGMGAMHLDSLTLPPFAVYIGELRY